jgi:hypothetical protein
MKFSILALLLEASLTVLYIPGDGVSLGAVAGELENFLK